MPMPVTPSNPMAALVNLNLDAVALCNEGANSRAHIILTKRKEKENMPETFEALLKALTPEQAKLVTDHIASLTAANQDVVKGLNETISTLKSENDTLKKSTTGSEDVLKNASPEIKQLVEKLQSTVNTLVSEREEDVVKARFETVKAIPVEETALKSVLKSASPAVYEVLQKAAAALEAGLAPKGKETDNTFAGSSADDIYAKLEKSAKTIMAENAGMTFEKAFTQACVNDPESYAKYTKGVK